MGIKTHTVTLQDTMQTFPCREDEFILNAMWAAGIKKVPCGCCGGGCGVCKMKVLNGDVHIHKKMSAAHVSPQEVRQGIVLLCCAQPRGDVVVQQLAEKKGS